ncbi:hypothetical protein ADK55_32075 [Streptomyces sp. WM4235]|nr:hypothetical protein ADK55_32075 [Streptomyces sp. WM4235]
MEGHRPTIEYGGKQVRHLVLRLGAGVSGQNAKGRAVESGNECRAGNLDDIVRASLAHAPESGKILQVIGCRFCWRHPHMIPCTRWPRRTHFDPASI